MPPLSVDRRHIKGHNSPINETIYGVFFLKNMVI